MRKKIAASTFILLATLLINCSGSFSSPLSYKTPFFEGFESGSKTNFWDSELPFASSGKVVKAPVYSGSYSFRVELARTDPEVAGNKRAEIALDTEKPLEEHWYGVSIYLPSDKNEYYSDDETSPESLIQWHNFPDSGEDWTSPPLSLITQNGSYYVSRCWDNAPVTSDYQMYKKGNYSLHFLGSYKNDIGKWVRWVFHIKWGWSESQNPVLEVYKDGKKVLEQNGFPNTTNDKKGVYLKVGIYKWDWKLKSSLSNLTKRVVYYDSISIDNDNDINTSRAVENTNIFNSGNILSGSSPFIEDFESSKISLRWNTELPKASNAYISTFSASGSYSFRAELNQSDPEIAGNKRAEITLKNEKPLEEHWYGIDIFLPANADEYYKIDCSSESLIQWHNFPDAGEDWTSPPLEFGTYNGDYYLSRCWDDSPVTSDYQMTKKGNTALQNLGSYQNDIGKWIRWVFHVKWGWSRSQSPLLEVYKNGKKLLDLSGFPNMTNDKKGIYWKIGINKSAWKSHSFISNTVKRVVYFDNISLDQTGDIINPME